ncbi:MAG: trypsin-like serine peptidase [Phreatobacter sp.]
MRRDGEHAPRPAEALDGEAGTVTGRRMIAGHVPNRRSVVGIAGSLVAVSVMLLALAATGLRAEPDRAERTRLVAAAAAGDERHIVDARVPPYSAVGRFVGTAACTAALVLHPRIIVTAAHCVVDRNDQLRRSELSFQLGYRGGTDLGRFAATVWAIGSSRQYNHPSARDASNDWVILVLDRAPVGVRPFLLDDHPPGDLRSLSRQIFLPSYSDDLADAQALTVGPACSIRTIVWNVLMHDCQGSAGSSGAVLLLPDAEGYRVVGIHSGAVLVPDDTMTPEGSAVGAWTFSKTLREIADALLRDDNVDGRPAYSKRASWHPSTSENSRQR